MPHKWYCLLATIASPGSTSPPFVPVSVKISGFRWYQSDPFYNNDDDDGDSHKSLFGFPKIQSK